MMSKHKKSAHALSAESSAVPVVLATYPIGDEGMGLLGLTHPVVYTRDVWTIRLSEEDRGRPVDIKIYPVFTDADGVPYFVEPAQYKLPGPGDYKPVPRTKDGLLLELPRLPAGDQAGLLLSFEASPQGDASGKKKKRKLEGGLTARPDGGDA